MLNHYEAAMLLTPGMSDKDVEKFVAEMREMIGNHGATEIDDGRVDRRTLAYPVKKNTEGWYVFIQFDAPPTLPDEMKVELRHREELLRLAFIRRPSPAELAARAEAEAAAAAPRIADEEDAGEPVFEPTPEPDPVADPETEPPAEEAPQPEPETGERDDG